MPFAVETLATKSINAISDDQEAHHDLDNEVINDIRTEFFTTLEGADARNRAKTWPSVIGQFPKYGGRFVSNDGRRMMYVAHGETTQQGMRPADELPQIVIIILDDWRETIRLEGHLDAIMSASWSPDDKTIVTASWDKFFRIWDATTGECRHVIGPTGGQNWAGAFSPNGKHVLLSGGSPTQVTTFDILTGQEVTRLPGKEQSNGMRLLSWHPAGDRIALIQGQSVTLWYPWETERPVTEVLKLMNDGTLLDRFAGLGQIDWVDGGSKLVVRTTDETTMVWDVEHMWKWRFQRPAGTLAKGFNSLSLFEQDRQVLVCLTGNGMVREWRL